MIPAAPPRRGVAYWSAAPSPVPTRPPVSEMAGTSSLFPVAAARLTWRPRERTRTLTQRELLMEMRGDIRGLKATVDAIARDQAAGVERRAAMQRSADSIPDRLDGHDRDIDRMQAW